MKIIKKIENGAIKIDFEDLPNLDMIDDFGEVTCNYHHGETRYQHILTAIFDENAITIKHGPIEISTEDFSDTFNLSSIKDIIEDRIRRYKCQYNYFMSLIDKYETLEFEIE